MLYTYSGNDLGMLIYCMLWLFVPPIHSQLVTLIGFSRYARFGLRCPYLKIYPSKCTNNSVPIYCCCFSESLPHTSLTHRFLGHNWNRHNQSKSCKWANLYTFLRIYSGSCFMEYFLLSYFQTTKSQVDNLLPSRCYWTTGPAIPHLSDCGSHGTNVR